MLYCVFTIGMVAGGAGLTGFLRIGVTVVCAILTEAAFSISHTVTAVLLNMLSYSVETHEAEYFNATIIHLFFPKRLHHRKQGLARWTD